MLLNQPATSTPQKIEGSLLRVRPHGRPPGGAMTAAAHALKWGRLDGAELCEGGRLNRSDHGVIIDESARGPIVESACGCGKTRGWGDGVGWATSELLNSPRRLEC
jgi:hypothetical protein